MYGFLEKEDNCRQCGGELSQANTHRIPSTEGLGRMQHFAIISRRYEQAIDFARVMKLPKSSWFFVNEPHKMRGRRNLITFTIGDYSIDRRFREKTEIARIVSDYILDVYHWRPEEALREAISSWPQDARHRIAEILQTQEQPK